MAKIRRTWMMCVMLVTLTAAGCSSLEAIEGGGDAERSLTSEEGSDADGVEGSDALGGGSATSAPGAMSDNRPSADEQPESAFGESAQDSAPLDPATSAGASAPPANTNVGFGGSQDFGFFRAQVEAGIMPRPDDFDASGFFAEHHTVLPDPICGNKVCLQVMMGVLGNLMNGETCTMLQVGLNSTETTDIANRPPLTLTVVVDVSGSMRTGNKIDFVRDGLEQLIDGLRDGDKLAIVTYASAVEVVAPMGEVSLRRGDLRAIARSLEANGGTNLHGGLQTGYEQVIANYDSARQNRVILLSDGQPTEGITSTESILDMSEVYNSEGVGLTTIGLGTSFNFELMNGLALRGDGNFYFLENSGAVNEVFSEELSYFTVPVAFDVQLRVRAGSDYVFGRAHGSPLWVDAGGAGGNLDLPSVFLAHRESQDDITDEGGRRGGGSALLLELMPRLTEDDGSELSEARVATVDISFREPGSEEPITEQVTVDYPYAPWETPLAGFWQSPDTSIVQKSFVMLNAYVALEMASNMFYQGELQEAFDIVVNVIAGIEDYNEEIEDEDMNADLALLRDVRDLISSNIPGVVEPVISDDPWPSD